MDKASVYTHHHMFKSHIGRIKMAGRTLLDSKQLPMLVTAEVLRMSSTHGCTLGSRPLH